MNVFDEIMGAIDILISRKIKNVSSFDFCSVIEVNDKKCTIVYNGNEYILPFYGNTPVINKKYPIFLPDGNLSQAFIIG